MGSQADVHESCQLTEALTFGTGRAMQDLSMVQLFLGGKVKAPSGAERRKKLPNPPSPPLHNHSLVTDAYVSFKFEAVVTSGQTKMFPYNLVWHQESALLAGEKERRKL